MTPTPLNFLGTIYKKAEQTLASLKFAVVIIALFTLSLAYGTFMESYHGRDFASRMVYKSWWFMLIQAFMFLSILMATLVRLPPKKRLYGFYTIHAGLITLFIGSFVTYKSGVDGMVELLPGKPTNTVVIDQDLFEVHVKSTGKLYDVQLPYTPGETRIGGDLPEVGLKLLNYLPSARYELDWVDSTQKGLGSGLYQIFNDNMSETVELSLNTESDFESMKKMGPLSVHMMPAALFDCFLLEGKSGHILWNVETNECFPPETRKIKVEKTPKGTTFFVYPFNGQFLKFFPDFSPFPVKDDLSKDESSPLRVMSKRLFEGKPHLFVFGPRVVAHSKRKGWRGQDLNQGIAKLPWMGFQLRLIKYSDTQYPVKVPVYQKPIQDGDKIVEGGMSAVQVELAGQKYWITTEAPLALSGGQEQLRMQIKKKTLKLPYQITLSKFNMEKNPGTDTPASFESYVSVLDGRTKQAASTHHIFMNNPLKYDGFTFYQSSYFPVGPDQFGSALSVNFDPGRWIKYLGSLLIVIGSIWHFYLRRSRLRRNPAAPASANDIPNGELNA